jgi:hypothetical protein
MRQVAAGQADDQRARVGRRRVCALDAVAHAVPPRVSLAVLPASVAVPLAMGRAEERVAIGPRLAAVHAEAGRDARGPLLGMACAVTGSVVGGLGEAHGASLSSDSARSRSCREY